MLHFAFVACGGTMFERFSKSLLGLFRPEPSKPGGKGKNKGKGGPASVRDEALARVRENQSKVMTPERAELIRNALEVQRAKRAILADLDDEQKQKLVAMALRAFLNEGRPEEAAKAPGKSAKGAAPPPAPPRKGR